MSVQNWEKVKDVFALALEEPGERRAVFLREICGDDLELRQEVESLLAADGQTAHLIDRNDYALASVLKSNRQIYEGKEFGHYEILRESGRGGMGAVFLAERSDGAFKQQVALKIMRRSFDNSDLARRFRQERQILASLNHPNIARLLDGGVSADGEPFLAMEYVEGAPINEFCEERNLSTNERLKLFLQVCQAVAYAHQNLVVHRDIKPSNILVTKDGVPKLLDFGIAKLLDEEHSNQHTQTNLRAFTPEYASPEQITGAQITTASDVYSLGVLLSRLIQSQNSKTQISSEAKTIPQNTKTKVEVRRTNDELGAILGMAQREEPERRYASVQQFAEDIQRYLDGLPVRAQKDSFSYRAKKFINRNKVPVFAAALVVLSLFAGLAVSLWQANVARQQRDRAERRFNDVRQLSNSLLFDIVPKIERLEGSTEARQALVTQSLKYLDSLASESTDDLGLQSELAAAYEKVGSLQGQSNKPNLGDFRGARSSYEKAQVIRRRILEKSPNDAENRRLLAENLRRVSIIVWDSYDFQTSNKYNAEAIEIYKKLIAENLDSLELQTAYLETEIENAQGYTDNNQYAEAIPLLRQTLARLDELKQKPPNNVEILRVLSKAQATLGNALSWNEQQPEAEAEMARAIEIAEALVAKNPNDANFRQGLWATYLLASGIYEDIDNARAFQLSEKALKVVEETIALDKANAQARYNLAKTFSRLGAVSANLGKSVEALAYLEKAAAILSELVEKDLQNPTYKRDLGIAYTRIGSAKYKARDLTAALAEFEKSATIYQQIYQANTENTFVLRDIAIARKNIGYIHSDLARTANVEKREQHLQAAKENYQSALDILLQSKSNNSFAEVDQKFLEEMQAAVRQNNQSNFQVNETENKK